MDQFPALLLLAPLFAAFIIFIAGWQGRNIHIPVGVIALVISVASCLGLLFQVLAEGPVQYRLGGWAPPMGIEYYVDHLTAMVLSVVSIIALLNLIATRKLIEEEYSGNVPVFYCMYMLAVAGHLGIVATGDAFNLFVLLEISALSGYALLAMGNARAALSTLRYLFMGTMGASLYLLGVGYLYIMTGSLNMQDLAGILPAISSSPAIMASFGMIMVGIWIKAAFFPLHSWLPGAYGDAGNPAASLIAPLTTKVMIYVMIRIIITVLGTEFVFSIPDLSDIIVWLASIAIVLTSFSALAQRDIKRMLTFILITEVAYMVGGFWLGNRDGMTGAILHILNDAVMTFCVFLAAGAIMHKLKSTRFEDIKGLFNKMPLTMGCFVIGALSMIGVPPTCGFFSKWYLVSGGFEAGHFQFAAALIMSSLVNIILFFRIFEISFFEPFHSGHNSEGDHVHAHATHTGAAFDEAPWSLIVPLMITAAALVAIGLYTGVIVEHVILPVIPADIV
jgi:multicomponent Na+:H+ antiporter subunit D